MPVGGQNVPNAQFAHDDKTRAVGKRIAGTTPPITTPPPTAYLWIPCQRLWEAVNLLALFSRRQHDVHQHDVRSVQGLIDSTILSGWQSFSGAFRGSRGLDPRLLWEIVGVTPPKEWRNSAPTFALKPILPILGL